MGHEDIVIGILQLGDGCGGGSALRPESVDVEELTVKPVRDSDTFGPIFSCKMYDGRDEYGEEGGSDYTTLLYSSVNPEGFCFNSTTLTTVADIMEQSQYLDVFVWAANLFARTSQRA